MDAPRKAGTYTIDDIYALPDGVRAELIDENLYYMAHPSTKHQRLVHFLIERLGIIFRVIMEHVRFSQRPLLYF